MKNNDGSGNRRKLAIFTVGLTFLLLNLSCTACTAKAGGHNTAINNPVQNGLCSDHSDFAGSIILGRPENNTITASITTSSLSTIYLEWGEKSGTYTYKSSEADCSALNPALVTMDGLTAGKMYYYRVWYKLRTGNAYASSNEYHFVTPRNSGTSYNFVIQSDSHLLNKADKVLYTQSMQSMSALNPDFMFDLGDTFLNDQKTNALSQSYDNIEQTVTQQLPYFDIVTRNAPLFLTIGNHEGEYGAYLNGTMENLAAKAAKARTMYFPNPVPDSFYAGNNQIDAASAELPQDYYAFTWGDALYVAIDPYRYSTIDPDNAKDGWDWTLGQEQYEWFRTTLEKSNAKYKFVFAHHAIGNVRGGEQIAKLYEWGGYDKNGQYLFDTKRPGWGKPVQQVMKDTGVTIFFQGHDHLFAREDVDGVVYQTLPKPAEVTADKQSNTAAYPNGDVLLNSGFLNVTVTPENVRVDYNRSYFVSSASQEGNTGVVYSYTVDSQHNVNVLKTTTDDLTLYGTRSQMTDTNSKNNNGTTATTSSSSSAPIRASENEFSFAVQADSHLDANTDIDLYKQTLSNIANAKPLFLIDLGDTSMAEKYAHTEEDVNARFSTSRSYFDLLGTIPVYLVTGNHDGENGWDVGSGMQSWARASRQTYFPMPEILAYTGNTTSANYYTFVKNNAQFIVLDPFTFSTEKARTNTDGWCYTLGKTQYDWLVSNLKKSTSKYKFVFIHNLVGGEGKDARGGAEAAKFYEWGGSNPDGSYGFAQMRPGWGKPIHELLVDYGVTAVFHGHDHFYARQELDGIIYQLVPQPGGNKNTISSASEYGYDSGTLLPPAGYIQVTVTSSEVRVEYVTTSESTEQNSKVADSVILE